MAIIRKLAYAGWPSTKVIPEKKEVQVHARYITPAMQQLSWKVGRLGCLVIVVWILYKFRGLWDYTYRPPPLGSILWILFIKITPYLGGWIVFSKYALPFLLRTKVTIIFNHYLIKIKPPWGLWKKFPRNEGHVFNIAPSGKYAESYEFQFAHGLDYIVLPDIHGAITTNKLNVRLNDIRDKMNVWFPDEWEGASAQVLDFSDLDRADWPMTEKEKARWPLKEFLWMVVCGIFAGTGFVYLLFYSSSLLHKILGHWNFINPPGNIESWLGDAKYFWPAFVGTTFLVLYAVIAKGVFDLFKVFRFAVRSERVLGSHQGWRLEKDGYFRLILGLIHWAIAFFIAIPLFYTFAPGPLNYIFKPCDPQSNWPCFRLLLIDLKGMVPGVVLGGLGGLGILYLANLNKAVLDFPWKLRFGKRDLGFRDFLFSFYDIDREKISITDKIFSPFRWEISTIQFWLILFTFILVNLIFIAWGDFINPLLGIPWMDLWQNTTWFKWVHSITLFYLALIIADILLKKIEKKIKGQSGQQGKESNQGGSEIVNVEGMMNNERSKPIDIGESEPDKNILFKCVGLSTSIVVFCGLCYFTLIKIIWGDTGILKVKNFFLIQDTVHQGLFLCLPIGVIILSSFNMSKNNWWNNYFGAGVNREGPFKSSLLFLILLGNCILGSLVGSIAAMSPLIVLILISEFLNVMSMDTITVMIEKSPWIGIVIIIFMVWFVVMFVDKCIIQSSKTKEKLFPARA